jgi:hypothetical protein
MTRQMPYEPSPASVLFALGWVEARYHRFRIEFWMIGGRSAELGGDAGNAEAGDRENEEGDGGGLGEFGIPLKSRCVSF